MKTIRLHLIAMVICAFVAACGVKSSPKPPLGGVPPKMGRVGVKPRENVILVRWAVPRSGPKSAFTQPVAFEIQRRSKAPGSEVWGQYEAVATVGLPATGRKLEWSDGKIRAGVEYEYRVVAIDAEGNRGKQSKALTTRWDIPPGAPSNIEAQTDDRSVALRWQPPTEGPKAGGYFVYRAKKDGDFVLANEMAIPYPEYFDANLKNGVTYRYVVRAIRTAGTYVVEGPASEVIEVVPRDKTTPQVPLGVGAFIIDEGVKVIWWPNNEEDLAGYHVYRTYRGKTERITEEPVREATYIDADATRRGSYRYKVTAIDKTGNESPHSEPAKVYVK